MPKISSYPLITTVTDQDLFVISDSSNNDATRSLQLETLKTYINEGEGAPGVTSLSVGLDYLTNEPTVRLSASSGNVTVYGQTSYLTGDGTFGGSSGTGVNLQLNRYLSYGSGLTQYPASTIRLAQGNNIQITTAKVSTTDQITFSVVGDTITSLTTTGTSGEATFSNGVLNIPQYSGGSGGTVTSIATTAPITGGTITGAGTIGITQASTNTNGYLSSADWNTFNNKSSFDGQYSSLTGAPTLATVATTGSYNDLSDQPTIPTVPANIVETVTTTDGTFINLTPDAATDGAVTVTADLSATGTASATTFLRGDNTWAVPPGGGGGVVTSLTTNGTSGPATLISGVLNIPEYSGSSGGGTVESFQKQLQIIFSPTQLNGFNNNATLELPILSAPGAKKIIIVDEVSTLKYFPSGSSSGETNYSFSSDLAVTLRGVTAAVNNSYSGHRVVLNYSNYLNQVNNSIGQRLTVNNPYAPTNSQNLSATNFFNKPLVLQWHNQQLSTHTVGGNGSWSIVLIINYTILDWSDIL